MDELVRPLAPRMQSTCASDQVKSMSLYWNPDMSRCYACESVCSERPKVELFWDVPVVRVLREAEKDNAELIVF